MAAVEQNLIYKREALSGDTLEIHIRPLEIKARTIRFIHEMTDVVSGETLATCELVGVHLDAVLRKSIALPDGVRKAIEKLL